MKTYKFDYTFCPETLPYFDSSLRDEVLTVCYNIIAGQIHVNEVRLWTDGVRYFDLLPILLAFDGSKEIERAAASDYEGRKVEQMYNNYPHLANPLTTEEKVEILKLK
jgi:hypothetical protein